MDYRHECTHDNQLIQIVRALEKEKKLDIFFDCFGLDGLGELP